MPATARLAHAAASPLGERNFRRLAAFIHDQAGIKMPANKKAMLESRLRRRLDATGARTLDEYCDFLFAGTNADRERPHLINAVTTNKTDFFREPVHFTYLRETLLPALAARGSQPVRAWSAACSTGPEAYTIAMVLDDFAAGGAGPAFGILATDIDTEVLAIARAGIYPAQLLDPVPPLLRHKYVMSPRNPARREVRIAPALRSAIGFARLNLMDDHYPIGAPMDLIFCRNVLIYFDKPTQFRVVSRLTDCLAPGGHLFLGHSESITGLDLPLEQVANTVFRRS
ncbi:CheR family methyltransferase [uncultured Sphingomonas sp.]|uniref:CheR family methyltransferase n=1 Tax=uncultured Sphingomonas sp. TaxID=158754 RepID=UPI002630F507|nr:CheR family methyltransferase [uncultured Sphingomonas sp.]